MVVFRAVVICVAVVLYLVQGVMWVGIQMQVGRNDKGGSVLGERGE